MRLLALADEPPPDDPAGLARANGVDGVVTLGDLSADVLAPLSALDLPVLGVHGNHDDEGDLSALGIHDLHLARLELGEWSFVGFEGSVRYRPDAPHQYTQEEADELVGSLPGADVLLTHSPPLGVNDDPDDRAQAGFRALGDWVERHRPAYLLHGHTTPDPRRRVHRLGPTQVVWVRGARTIELRGR